MKKIIVLLCLFFSHLLQSVPAYKRDDVIKLLNAILCPIADLVSKEDFVLKKDESFKQVWDDLNNLGKDFNDNKYQYFECESFKTMMDIIRDVETKCNRRRYLLPILPVVEAPEVLCFKIICEMSDEASSQSPPHINPEELARKIATIQKKKKLCCFGK